MPVIGYLLTCCKRALGTYDKRVLYNWESHSKYISPQTQFFSEPQEIIPPGSPFYFSSHRHLLSRGVLEMLYQECRSQFKLLIPSFPFFSSLSSSWETNSSLKAKDFGLKVTSVWVCECDSVGQVIAGLYEASGSFLAPQKTRPPNELLGSQPSRGRGRLAASAAYWVWLQMNFVGLYSRRKKQEQVSREFSEVTNTLKKVWSKYSDNQPLDPGSKATLLRNFLSP